MKAQPQGEQSYSLGLLLLAQTPASSEGSGVFNLLASLQPPGLTASAVLALEKLQSPAPGD